MTHRSFLLILSSVMSANLLISTGLTQIASARSISLAAQQSSRLGLPVLMSLDFRPPNRGTPRTTAGGASRGSCVESKTAPTALAPHNDIGLTTQAYPTFFFYVPRNTARSAEFILYSDQADNSRQKIYDVSFAITGESGIIQVHLPKSSGLPPLQVNQSYLWRFTLQCGEGTSAEYIRQWGWVERVALDAQTTAQLAKTPKRQHPQIYAKAGLWYDLLAALTELRNENPNDRALTRDWQAALSAIGLENLADQPFLKCCTAEATPSDASAL